MIPDMELIMAFKKGKKKVKIDLKRKLAGKAKKMSMPIAMQFAMKKEKA
jgi:hypothetical protein